MLLGNDPNFYYISLDLLGDEEPNFVNPYLNVFDANESIHNSFANYDDERTASEFFQAQTQMESTLLPGWEKINLKETKIEPQKDNAFKLVHKKEIAKKGKKKDEVIYEMKEIKDHFLCRNECSKSVWLEKLAVAQKVKVIEKKEDSEVFASFAEGL